MSTDCRRTVDGGCDGGRVPDPLFFVPLPHADLHAVRNGPQLTLDVQMMSRSDTSQKVYASTSVFNKTVGAQLFTAEVTFLAQHLEPPNRFTGTPSVDPLTGKVTVNAPGVYLFQVAVFSTLGGTKTPIGSVVGRLQVHEQIVDWWFGNRSITTAKDGIGHAQPTIYARFTPDGSGTDVVGDITGHDYVPLTPSDTTKVKVAPRGRLIGLAETATAVKLTGDFIGKKHDLDVRVIDYAKPRGDELKTVRIASRDDLPGRSNLVFVAEGFRDTPDDRALFTNAVTAAVKRMFTQPRHEPFSMLRNRYNVFQLFAPSQERGITTGFPVTHTQGVVGTSGLRIPYDGTFGHIPTTLTLANLITRVGLPARGETHTPAELRTHWHRQRPELTVADLNAFPNALIDEWKAHRAEAFQDAVDSRFGMYLGGRFADTQPELTLSQPVDPRDRTDPNNPVLIDDPTKPAMQQFVSKLYGFFVPKDQVEVAPDPRRHPPELYGFNSLTNPGLSIMSYLAGQSFSYPFDLPGTGVAIGKEWTPNDVDPLPKPTPSRGLVVIVTYEDLKGGLALNNSSAVGVTVSDKFRTILGAPVTGQPERLTRVLPAPPPAPSLPPPDTDPAIGIVQLDAFTNVFTHELGHTYALADEYEAPVDAVPDVATFAAEVRADNVTRLGVVKFGDVADRTIDPDKVKWFKLPRIRISSRLLQTAQPSGGTIKVQVAPLDIPLWTQVFNQKPPVPVSLRRYTSSPTRVQLPLSERNPAEFQDNLLIKSPPDPVTGTVELTYTTGLPPKPPQFPPGSALFVPQPNFVVDNSVLNVLRTTHKPLNHRPLAHPTHGSLFAPEAPDPKPGLPVLALNSFRTVGLYEGADHSTLGKYRPTGSCKMRNAEIEEAASAFCFVCRWLIVNAVDPGQHVLLDTWYPGGRHG